MYVRGRHTKFGLSLRMLQVLPDTGRSSECGDEDVLLLLLSYEQARRGTAAVVLVSFFFPQKIYVMETPWPPFTFGLSRSLITAFHLAFTLQTENLRRVHFTARTHL